MSRHQSRREAGYRKHVPDASPVRTAAGRAQADDGPSHTSCVGPSKPASQPRGENTGDRPGRAHAPQGRGGSASSGHSVFVLDCQGRPLTPTTAAKARKLLRAGVAAKAWSKFGTFGIRLLVATRHETPQTTLGVDHGTKFEGYSVIVDQENNLNVKLDLPDKKKVLKKIEDRRVLRRARRFRNCRRRPCRSDNRSRKNFLAPSQKVIVDSRLKILRELCRVYPVSVAGIEDVCFNHAAKRRGRTSRRWRSARRRSARSSLSKRSTSRNTRDTKPRSFARDSAITRQRTSQRIASNRIAPIHWRWRAPWAWKSLLSLVRFSRSMTAIVPCAGACMIRSRAREEFESRIRQGRCLVFGKGS